MRQPCLLDLAPSIVKTIYEENRTSLEESPKELRRAIRLMIGYTLGRTDKRDTTHHSIVYGAWCLRRVHGDRWLCCRRLPLCGCALTSALR